MVWWRYVVPRRKENVLTFATLAFFACCLFYYCTSESEEVAPHTDSGRAVRHGAVRHVIPDYTKPRSGPGENGKGVVLSGEKKKQGEEDMRKWFMNVAASDSVSLDRSLQDTRRSECKAIEYDLDTLPKASVVIIFTDEAWTPLLRTVHSVVNRSPPQLLEEVILLDDNSQRDELKAPLDEYITRFGGLVKLIRSSERLGLIRAKLQGGKAATGEVIVFLDSHCEANTGWLEPLVQRIKDNRKAIICPMIDHIDAESMSYWGDAMSTSVGGFSWALHFTWESMPQHERTRRKSVTEHIRSPTMAGGLLAADREYFFEVGGYDAEMDIWGGENLEISFRTWMCGGSIEFIPCSHVGHIFRAGHPYNMTGRGGNKDVHGTNSKRLAEVWMDDYKRLYYLHRPDLVHKDVGDLSSRHALRKSLDCRPFKWYLDNIVPGKFLLDEDVIAYGTLFTYTAGTKMCVDTLQRDEHSAFNLGIFPCQGAGSSAQVISLSKKRVLRREQSCAHAVLASSGHKGHIQMRGCGGGEETWTWKDGQLRHDSSGLCLSTEGLHASDDVVLSPCDSTIEHQKWKFVDPKTVV